MRTLVLALPLCVFASFCACAQTASSPQIEDRPVRISGGVIAGNIVKKVQPTFPEEAREKHVNGTVVMRVLIGKDGHIKSAEAISGPDLLRQPYVEAVKQWIYKPYLLNGEPVEVDTTITMSIQANGGPDAANAPPQSVTPVELSTFSPNLVPTDDPSKPLRVSGGIVAGAILRHAVPVFPPETSCLRVNHTVVVRAIIGTDGDIKSTEVISGAYAFRQPMIDAIKQWIYKPFQLNGQPVEVETTIVSNLNLNCEVR